MRESNALALQTSAFASFVRLGPLWLREQFQSLQMRFWLRPVSEGAKVDSASPSSTDCWQQQYQLFHASLLLPSILSSRNTEVNLHLFNLYASREQLQCNL